MDQIQKKLMTTNKFKKTLFLAHFPKFWGKTIFLENQALSCTTSNGFLELCQNLEKVNDTIQQKCPDRQMGGRTDRPYFIGLFWLLPGFQKIRNYER